MLNSGESIKDRIEHNLYIIEIFENGVDDKSDELGKSIENVVKRIFRYFEDEEKLIGDRERACFLRKRFEKNLESSKLNDILKKGGDLKKDGDLKNEEVKKTGKLNFTGVSSDSVNFEEIERQKEIERKNQELKKIEDYNKKLLARFKNKKNIEEEQNFEFCDVKKKEVYFEFPAPPKNKKNDKIEKNENIKKIEKEEVHFEHLDFEDIDLINLEDIDLKNLEEEKKPEKKIKI